MFERRLTVQIEEHLPRAAPGLRIQVHKGGEKLCDAALGETYAFYDLASLTKIIFTVPALVAAYDKGLWSLNSTVGDFWPGFPAPGVKLTDLLTHRSGALWWYPFYKEIDIFASEPKRRATLKHKIQGLEWKASGEPVYSDIGMLVLGFCLESMFQKPLAEIWLDLKALAYSRMESIDFHYDNRSPLPQTMYAPTEICPWRGRRLQGEVHDENAWSFGGVSSHAGLFGGIDDVSAYGLLLRSHLMGHAAPWLRAKTLSALTAHVRGERRGDWAFGFMRPAPEGASCGQRFSPSSIGHTGFTGTSLWYDPYADLLVVILSNRVFFGREREDFKRLRPQIHDWVVEGLSCG